MIGALLISTVALVSQVTGQCNNTMPDGTPCPIEHDVVFTYPDPTSCSHYWECFNMCFNRQQCQYDYLYDDVHKWCNFQESVDCGDRPCNDPNHCDHYSPKPDSTTQGNDCGHDFDCTAVEDGWYADSFNCRKYWHCLDGVGEHLMCRDNLLYDPVNVWCDYPANVDCGNRPVCDECDEHCENPTSPPECQNVDCSTHGDGYYAEECCSPDFCRCLAGHGTPMHCQQGLVFNEPMQICDWPANLPCC